MESGVLLWVCGCGSWQRHWNPYRQHSDKRWRLGNWKVVDSCCFCILLLMTIVTLYAYFSGASSLLGIKSQWIKDTYGFLIGSWFAGDWTGFYPIFGNRVWCRFGCPLAAYLGLVQRFKSRFRITTNGGQCISCGNCSTYCGRESMYVLTHKRVKILFALAVLVVVCAAVCPRGVLKLEMVESLGVSTYSRYIGQYVDRLVGKSKITIGQKILVLGLLHSLWSLSRR